MNDTARLLPYLKLRFNVDHPSFEECYVYGYECALAEISEGENPYPQGSKLNEQWLEGWWAGFYGDRPLFEVEQIEAESFEFDAANDQAFQEKTDNFLLKFLEISGVIVVSAFVGYQLIELVA